MIPEREPGEPLIITGVVRDSAGVPIAGAVVHAWQTDRDGHYSRGLVAAPRGPDDEQHPRLFGYRFRTIRPGGYPATDDPQHIHLHIDAAVHQHTYRTLWFEDDSRVTPAKRRALDRETVIVPLRKRNDGVWTTRFDVRLEGS